MTALALARPSTAAQFRSLTRQSLRRALHDPSALVVPVAFPLAVLAINVAGLQAAASLPGFPTDHIIDFAIGLTFLQGSLFAAIPAATDLAVDVESGFLDRLAMAPVSAGLLLAARMGAVVAMGAVRCACFLLVAFAAGASMSVGAGGVGAIFVLQLLLDLALTSVAFLVALRSRSGEVVQSLFPIFFVFLLLSSALMPRELIDVRWFEILAAINPISYLVEAFRSLFLGGWDAGALLAGAATSAVIALAAGSACVLGLRPLMARSE
jgi:ABC-2 type transport system permease protein